MNNIHLQSHIASLQNNRIKEVIKLSKRAKRDERQLTVIEGLREISRALACGVVPVEGYICPELITTPEAEALCIALDQLAAEQQTHLFSVTPQVFAKLAYRGESGGLLLVIPYGQKKLDDLMLGKRPFIAVVENVEKPGNLGAILRTADGAGVDGLICCVSADSRGNTDVHNPNVIRASLGTLFSVPVVETSTEETIQWLHKNSISIIATMPESRQNYTAVDFTQSAAVVMGSEAHGLSPAWHTAAHDQVKIPMLGISDSLNLSTATALLLYEVVRQRLGHE